MPTSERTPRETAARWRAWCAVASTMIAGFLGLASCGYGVVPQGHLERHLRGQPWAPWAGRVGPAVANLNITGGQPIAFVVVECRHEPQCHEIGYYMQPAYKTVNAPSTKGRA